LPDHHPLAVNCIISPNIQLNQTYWQMLKQ